jgi:hypothetical protein
MPYTDHFADNSREWARNEKVNKGNVMRLFLAILVLTVLVSCGKDDSAKSPQNENGRGATETRSADAIYDGLGVDILETTIDIPAIVSSDEITFIETKSMRSEGRRINCSSSVNKGDSYRYSIKGNTLYLSTPVGNMDMKRVQDADGIAGTWKWMGLVEGTTLETRLLTVTKKMNRVILKNICER